MSAWQILFFALQSINPVAGILASIPVAILSFKWHPLVVAGFAVPLCYAQVIAVDCFWNRLVSWKRFADFLEKKRSPQIEKLVASKGAFLSTAIISPLIGPWVVMGFMKYAGVPQRKVGLPIAIGIAWMTTLLATLSALAPYLLKTFGKALPLVGGGIVIVVLGIILIPKLLNKKTPEI
jgi:hypothetical protein